MEIVRVQHKRDGYGLFRSRTSRANIVRIDKIPKLNDLSKRHSAFPTPINDKGIKRYPDYEERCAYKSIEQLTTWITPEELKILINNGFIILLITASECTVGDYQILYHPKNITKCIDISELFL